MKKVGKLLVLLLFCFIFCSCGTLAPVTSGITLDTLDNGIVQIENATFSEYIEMVEERSIVTEGDFLKIQIKVKNKYEKDLSIQYQFVWYDKDGMVMNEATQAWKVAMFVGREEGVLQGICPLAGAKEFKLIIRPFSL